jgi:hypothetical protein
MMMVVAEDERRFRQLGSTLNHLRSITSAEVMAAFSRPRRRAILFLLPSLLSLSLSRPLSVCSRLAASSAPFYITRPVLLSTFQPPLHPGCRWGSAVQVCPRLHAI